MSNGVDEQAMNAAAVIGAAKTALAAAEQYDAPYPHWIMRDLAPPPLVDALAGVDFPAPDLGGVSGKRELHNDQRHYFDAENASRIPAMAAVAAAYQSSDLVSTLAALSGAQLDDTFLRIEYAVDVTGFWLEPHTDLGVKRLTLLHYISDEPGQEDCGTDIYNPDKTHAKRAPFEKNLAFMFVPGDATYHGYESRPIAGLRKSLIINYVTHDWRDREQLCFPEEPVRI